MTRLSAALRRKPDWWIKCRDQDILAKWRTEALAQAEQMRESHVDYVLQELDGYANLRNEETGAEVRNIAVCKRDISLNLNRRAGLVLRPYLAVGQASSPLAEGATDRWRFKTRECA